MAKRLFAWVLALALVLSMIPAITLGITAEESLDKHTGHEGWTEWTDTTKLPTEAGKYYLSADVTLTSGWYASTEIHLCLNSHNITQTTAGSRVLGVAKGGNVSIYDCTGTTNEDGIYTAGQLTGGSQIIGAGVNVNRGGVFNLYGGKIVGNSKSGTDGGGVYLQAAKADSKTAGMFNMYGGQICGNSSKRGAGVFVAGGLSGEGYTNAVFNMYGGIIGGYGENDANVAEAEGGAIYAATYGAVNIQGGKIVGNKGKNGSAIYASDSIVVTAKNAQITGNTATSQGTIWTKGNVKVTLENTEISGNTAPVASAFYAQNNVQLAVRDSAITGNIGSNTSAEGYGAAVYLTGSGSRVVLEGKTYIHDNTIAKAGIADLYINSSSGADIEKVYVKDLNGYVRFGIHDKAASVTEASQVVAFEGAASTYAGASVSYMAGTEEKHVGLVDGAFTFVTGHFHQGVEYTKWTDSTKVPSSGTYYLDTDITVGTKGTVDGGATLRLCMNGHSISGNGKTGELLRVANGSAYICDCTTVYDENGYFVSGGKFENAKRKGNGAAVYANKATSVLVVEGVAFVGNSSTETSEGYGGGAVQVRETTDPAKFIGCLFEGNTSSGGAGALSLRDGGDVVLEKCVLTKNTAKHGGAIYITGTAAKPSSLVVDSCKIMENTADSVGGISNLGVCSVIIKDTHITGNTGTDGCGAVALSGGDAVVQLQGKVVIDGNTDKDGAARNLHLQAGNTVDVDFSGLGAGAKVGVSLSKDRIDAGDLFFSTAGMTAVPEGVTSDDADYQVVVDDQSRLALKGKDIVEEVHSHKLCNDEACTAHGDAVAFEKWDKTDSLPESGYYYLENDVKLTTFSPVTGELQLCLNGHTIKQTKAARVLYIQDGGSLTITDCGTTGTITGGRGDTGASIYLTDGTTFNLYAGKITGSAPASENKATSGAAIYLRSAAKAGATFNMYGGEITGNGGEKSWGGAITNAAGNANNCVYVNIYGGKIYGNTAATGGAIRMQNKSVTTICGGEIYGNEVTDRGGAIYLSSGSPELIIKGGKIYGNTATGGGAIYASSGAKITLEGDVTIYDNTASDKQNNLYLAGSDKITVGALKDTAKIGINAATINRAVSTEGDTDYSANFQPDNSKLTVSYKEKALWLEKIETSDHYHKVCADVTHGTCEHDKDQMWIKWGDDEEEKTSLPTTSGCYYLTQDIQMSAALVMQPNQDISLCLNGKTVTAAANNRHFALEYGTVMNITDCTDAPGGFTGGSRTFGGSVNIVTDSTLNLYAGKFYGNEAPNSEGGAIYLQGSKTVEASGIHRAGGVLNMYGGEIYGNTAKTGAGIRAAGIGTTGTKDPSIVNIYGGKIYDNYAKATVTVDPETQAESKSGGQGGGIAITSSTVMNMYGGEISGNKSDSDGAGVYMNSKSDLYIDGGKIENNAATGNGGGIFMTGTDSTVIMDSGSISGNSASNGGGMITQTQSFFTMNGGVVSGNTTTSNGAGIYVSTNTDFVMNGGTITGNTAKSAGGFFALRSRVTLNGGEVVGNVATYRGGAFQASGATMEINKVTIKGNEAPEGGAAYINRTSSGSGENIKYYPSTVNINDGALITENKGGANSGGFLIANEGVVVTMNGGEFSKNTATNGGAFMTWRGATFIVKGGKIVNNKVTGSGGGGYVSTASTFKMEGGSISNNTAKSAGGVYFLRCNGELTGGTISYNRAQHTSTWKNGTETKSGGTGGGIYISGAKVNFRGTSMLGNYSTVNGGAIMMGRASYTENGVKKYDLVTINISAGLFSGNKTDGAAGVMLMQSEGTVVNMYGGTMTDNQAKNGGAIYVSTKTTFNMTGGTITRNHADSYAGSLYFLKSTGNVTGGQIYANSSNTSAGSVMINGDTANVTIKNIKFHDDTAKTAGSLVVQSKGRVFVENCDYYDNTANGGTGGAVYISNNSYGDFTDCKFYNNTSDNASGAMHAAINAKINITRCDFTENSTETNGGAMYANPKTVINITDSTFTKNEAKGNGGALVCRSTMYLTNVTLENNTAANGGAIATDTNNTSGAGVMEGLVAKNCVIRNNTASAQGGAFYIWKGRPVRLFDTEVKGNTAGTEGGAIWAYEDTELHSTTITGNTSGGEGFAVYMNDANYDGHSYYTSKNKLSGNTVIKDNNGGDLWMGPDVAFAITAEGLGEDAHIELTMDSGLVTNRVLGIYHYEGGNQVYTITYGDRSMTDPEYDASLAYKGAQAQTGTDVNEKEASGDTWLYVGIGLIAVLIIAVGVILVVKKKKAGNPAEKASK